MTTTAASLAAQFNTQYQANLVPQILKTIKRVRQANQAIVALAMAISYSHQAHFLTVLGAGPFAYVVPIAFDLLIYVAIKVTQTPGLVAAARRAAIKLLVPAVAVSATVNALAHGHPLLRVLYAIVVAEIAAAEWLASKIKPDFAAVEHAVAEAAPTQPAVDAKRSESARRAAQTRKDKAAKQAAEDEARRERRRLARLARMERDMEVAFAESDAPVSPAVA